MKPFRFQQFTVQQSKDVFRLGTDGVLLGALCSADKSYRILEVGAGTGIISLMIAQRNPMAEILSLEINQDAARLAEQNFKNSPFASRLQAIHDDLKYFESGEKFDLIISNPPYFEINPSVKDVLARQKVELDFSDLVEKSSRLLKSGGIFSVILPAESGHEFIQICNQNDLNLSRKVNIYGIEGGMLKRVLLEFSTQPKDLVEEDFVIEKSPRQYSDQYLKQTSEFHVFGK